jgi:hypothetical protein
MCALSSLSEVPLWGGFASVSSSVASSIDQRRSEYLSIRCGSWQKSWPCYSGICRCDSLTRACPSWERGWRRLFDIRLEDLSPLAPAMVETASRTSRLTGSRSWLADRFRNQNNYEDRVVWRYQSCHTTRKALPQPKLGVNTRIQSRPCYMRTSFESVGSSVATNSTGKIYFEGLAVH